MPSTAKQAEATAYEGVRSHPFTRIHGRPTRTDFDTLKEEASTLVCEVEDINYQWSKNATDEYGLLADIIGAAEYEIMTTINTYAEPNEPAAYDTTINNATATHERKRKEEEWERTLTSWYIRKGFLKGVAENMRDALDEQYYAQLKHRLTKYRNIMPQKILDHLNDRWCPLDVMAKKQIRGAYYAKWDEEEHLTAFGKRLEDGQERLVRSDIIISDEDKLQFYLEQMYASGRFDKQEMLEWEKQPDITKADYTLAQAYFETLVKATDTYEQNAGTKPSRYESANQLADLGDEIRGYIQKIAGNNTEDAANVQTKEKLASLEAQISKLTETMTVLAASMNKENVQPGNDKNNKDKDWKQKVVPRTRNMGGYCYSCGFHPIGLGHSSKTCNSEHKRRDHKSEATWNDRMGGNTNWPKAFRVTPEQQEHAKWKGQEPPTN